MATQSTWGLISRVSSRTYRSFTTIVTNMEQIGDSRSFQKQATIKVVQNKLNKTVQKRYVKNVGLGIKTPMMLDPCLTSTKNAHSPVTWLFEADSYLCRHQIEDAEILHRPTRLPSLHQEVPTIRETTQDGFRPRFPMLARHRHRRYGHHR